MNKIKINNKLLTLTLAALMVVAVVIGLCIPKNTFSKASADVTAPTPLHTYSSKDYNLRINENFNKNLVTSSSSTVYAKININSTHTSLVSGLMCQLTIDGIFGSTINDISYNFSATPCAPEEKNVFLYFNGSALVPILPNINDFLSKVDFNIFEDFAFETLEIYDENVAEMFVLTEKPLHTYNSKDYNLHINSGFNKDFTAPSADKVFAKIKISSTCTLTLSGTTLIQLTGFENVASAFGIRYALSSSVVPFSKNVLLYFTASTINSPIPIRGNETDFKANVKLDILNDFAFETLEIYDENVAEMFVLTSKQSTITLQDGANSLGTLSVATNIKLDTVDFSTIVTKKDGFIFKGWSLTADGAVITDLATITIDKATTLYAVYDKASVDILDNIGNSLSKFFSSNFGLTVSSLGGVIILAVLCAIIFKRR